MTPDAKYHQQMGALEEANRIRFVRVNMKRNLQSGEVDVIDLIENPPEYINTMRLLKLLMATPGIGKAKAKRIMGPRISVDKTIADLTQRERDVIVWRLLRHVKDM